MVWYSWCDREILMIPYESCFEWAGKQHVTVWDLDKGAPHCSEYNSGQTLAAQQSRRAQGFSEYRGGLQMALQIKSNSTAQDLAYGRLRERCIWLEPEPTGVERAKSTSKWVSEISIDKLNLKILTVSDLRLDEEQVKGGSHSFTASYKHTEREREIFGFLSGWGLFYWLLLFLYWANFITMFSIPYPA